MNLTNQSFTTYHCSKCSREVCGLATMAVWCRPLCPPCAIAKGCHPPLPPPNPAFKVTTAHDLRVLGPAKKQGWIKGRKRTCFRGPAVD